MTREEVLKKSREENMGMDVAEAEAAKSGIKYGWMVTVFFFLYFCDSGWNYSFPYTFGDVVCSSIWSMYSVFIKVRKDKKRHELIIAALYGVASLCFLISWIIQISKI